MRLLEVAHRFRTAGQHIGEQRLGLGGAGFGGRPRPFERGGEIRLGRLLVGKQAIGSIAARRRRRDLARIARRAAPALRRARGRRRARASARLRPGWPARRSLRDSSSATRYSASAIPALAARVSSGKASAPCPVAQPDRPAQAAAGEAKPISRSRTGIRSPAAHGSRMPSCASGTMRPSR